MYKERTYRNWVKNDDLVFFEVVESETDLAISAERNLERQAREAILSYRQDIKNYIKKDAHFYTSLEPIEVRNDAPDIVKAMALAAKLAFVGPMAAVAGAIAEFVGRDLAVFSNELIIENGGDIFIRTSKKRILGIYAGDQSPFTGKIALEIAPSPDGIGVCTSSGTVSHSLSFGKSDAVIIIAKEAALADAVATAAGNIVKGPDDINKAIDSAKVIDGVKGVLVIVKDKMGSWGEVTIV